MMFEPRGREFLMKAETRGGRMEALLFITAAAGVISSPSSHEYRFVYEPMTWADAQSYCRRTNSDLATVATMEDMDTLNKMAVMKNMVYTSYSYRAWIGLYDDVDSWRWSLSDSGFYRTGEDSFRKWQSGEPNNWMSTERCGMMTGEGLWQDGGCSYARQPVCADITGPGVSFVLVQSGMNWTEAQSFCRKQHSDLASIRNESENQQVQQLVPAGTKVWTGLYRDGWKWSAGTRFSFSYWKSTEPNNSNGNEKCVSATFDALGKWEDWRCDVERAFICSSTVVFQKVVSVKLEKTSGLDLNSAAVLEELLSQLLLKLKQEGLNADVELSWTKQSDGNVFHKLKDKNPTSV